MRLLSNYQKQWTSFIHWFIRKFDKIYQTKPRNVIDFNIKNLEKRKVFSKQIEKEQVIWLVVTLECLLIRVGANWEWKEGAKQAEVRDSAAW